MATLSKTTRLCELEQELAQALQVIESLQVENKRLSDRITLLINRLYGRKSERIHPDQLRLFEDELKEAIEEAKEEEAKTKPGKRKGHGRAAFPAQLPRVEELHDLPEPERHCDECHAELLLIGEEVSERGHVIPAKIIVKRNVRMKYACPHGHQVKTAPAPPALIDRCKYEPSVYAHVAVSKYGDHLPLNRLSGIFKRHGVPLPRSTMWDMLVRVDELAAQPILARMREEILEERIVQADETPVTLRLEEGKGTKRSYIWVYRTPRKVLFDFTVDRKRDGPSRFFGTWRGVLQTDGYSGYDEITRRNGLIRAGCWAHVRRKFKEALDTGSKDAPCVLSLVQRLFRLESAVKKRAARLALDPEAFGELRHAVRQRRAKRILDRIRELCEEIEAKRSTLPRSVLGKALTYLLNQWPTLVRFLGEPAVEIHNNLAEQAIRPVALGRKNWMVFASPRGGQVASRLYSLVLSCKAMDINPEHYLADVLVRVSTTPASEIARLTPWAWAEEQRRNEGGETD